MPTTLGPVQKTARGFQVVYFKDSYQVGCRLQQSSVIYDDPPDALQRPGASAIWLGCIELNPRVMWKDAADVGVKTDQTAGWVKYPLPEQVLVSTEMHLDRTQVAALIKHLQKWLKTGKL